MPFDWTHPEFRFLSHRDWVQRQTDNDLQLQLYCAASETTLTMTVDPYQSTPDKLELLANGMLAIRKNTHLKGLQKLAPGGQVEVVYDFERVQRHHTGEAYEMSFAGCHKGKSLFGYLGYLTTRKIVHVFVDTKYSFAPGRGKMFHEVAQGFAIKLP